MNPLMKRHLRNLRDTLLGRMTFGRLEAAVNPWTKRHDRQIVAAAWARWEDSRTRPEADGGNSVVRRGRELHGRVLETFRGKYHGHVGPRILVHVPTPQASPAGYSLFSNLVRSFEVLGIPARALSWAGGELASVLDEFRPTILLTSDSRDYLDRLSWDTVADYRRKHSLRCGLTASLEAYGNTPLPARLDWAQRHDIDFFYSFRTQDYLHSRADYKPFFRAGFPLFSMEFGANPLYHFPEPGDQDLDYVFLGSSNPDKWPRYFDYLLPVIRHRGCLHGPGWSWVQSETIPDTGDYQYARDRFLYSRAKVGVNLHLQESIDWANELNERTYILAACGVPQLIDNPKLLPSRFSAEAVASARSPQEYRRLFQHLLKAPAEREKMALKALDEVFARHTTFHRAEQFYLDLAGQK